MLYEERARGIVAPNGQSVVAGPQGQRWLVAQRESVKVDVAARHSVRCPRHRARHLIVIRINDVVMSEVRTLQVHTGPPMKVQFKNVRLPQF